MKTTVNINARFVYDDGETYEDNFYRWHLAQTLERELHSMMPISEEDSREAFTSRWGHKRS